MLGVFRKLPRYAAALAVVCCALLPGRALAANSVLILQSSPQAGETVYPGDAVSYSVSVGRDGEHLDWAWLRITMGEGMRLVEESILLDCAKAIPVDLLPPDEDGVPATAPVPITRDTILGNDGFVLLSSALLNGDTISFMAVPEEGASLSLTAVLGEESVSISHTLGERPPEQTMSPAFVYVPPDQGEASDGLPLWARSLIAAVCVVAICAGVYYLLHRFGIAPGPAELLGGAPPTPTPGLAPQDPAPSEAVPPEPAPQEPIPQEPVTELHIPPNPYAELVPPFTPPTQPEPTPQEPAPQELTQPLPGGQESTVSLEQVRRMAERYRNLLEKPPPGVDE